MTDERPSLAPAPDFRYVGLEAGPRSRAGIWASATLGVATLGAGLVHGATLRGVLLTAIAAIAGGLALRRASGGVSLAKWKAQPVPMAIVPWGILVQPDDDPRVLRWAAIERVQVETIHGRDQGTPTTLYSVVIVHTKKGEALVGRSNGTAPLDRLLAYLEPYAREQAQVASLDLDGEKPGEGPLEPECEPLLSAARDWLGSADATARLDVPALGYRTGGARAGSERAVRVIGEVLRDRTERVADPRAFALVCAAELSLVELAEDVVALVQSPHPLVSAIAKSAAHKLGVATARAGALDEVTPFLMERDVDVLREWAAWRPSEV